MCNRNYTIEEKDIIETFKAENQPICIYCGKPIFKAEDITVDHKLPVCRGGLTIKENLAIACKKCNTEKDNMTEEEFSIYKSKQQEIQDTFEVNIVLKDIINLHNNTIKRIDEVKKEYAKIEKDIENIEQEISENNFNACEGYLYARDLKDLLIRKQELLILKDQYNNVHAALGNYTKQMYDTAKKVSDYVYNINKPIIKKQVINQSVITKVNVVNIEDYKEVVNS